MGSVIHCVEIKPGKGAQLVRSAGGSCQLVAREGGYATVRLRSGEMRRVLVECRATLGEVGNSEHNLRSLGKAGANRWRGKRPTVRGVAMNPVRALGRELSNVALWFGLRIVIIVSQCCMRIQWVVWRTAK